jgi:hypothetical protein
LRQTQATAGGSTASFLRITNLTGDQTKYYGVDITPYSASSRGAAPVTTVHINSPMVNDSLVSVTVHGNQLCSGRTSGVRRCFDIDPAVAMNAAVRFYFSEAERNDQQLDDLLVFHYNADWTEEPGPYTRGGSGDAQYVEAQNVDNFSLFALDTGGPPAVYLPWVLVRWPPVPDIPVLNAISNPGRDGNYTVSWQAAYLADTYVLQEDDNASFRSPTQVYAGSGTSKSITGRSPDTYYYRVKAINDWEGQQLESGWSNVRSVTVQAPHWVTILGTGFEGAFPGSIWTVYDNDPDSGRYYWGKRNCKDNGGSYSAWSAGAGDTTISCGSNYRNDVFAWMIYGPFSLADITAAELTFDWWSDTEFGYDIFFWGASIDGDEYYGTQVTGDFSSWTTGEKLDLSAVPNLGSLLGRNQVWIAFGFGSDGSITDKGSFVDNVLLRKWVGGSASTSQSSPSSQWTLQPDQTMEFVKLRLNQADVAPLLEEPR